MATVSELQAQIAQVESEISRLTERELQYQRFVIEVRQEILRATADQNQARVDELNQELAQRTQLLAETRAEIDTLLRELNDLRRRLTVALNNPAEVIIPEDAGEQPVPESSVKTEPAIQSNPPDPVVNTGERVTDFTLSEETFRQNNPVAYRQFKDLETSLIAQYEAAGDSRDEAKIQARDDAVTAFRAQAEAANALTVRATTVTAPRPISEIAVSPEPVDTRSSASQEADPEGIGAADDPEAQIFAEIVQAPEPQPAPVTLPEVVVEAELSEDPVPGLIDNAQQQPNILEPRGDSCFNNDWRVRLSLARESNYLYNASLPGILAPLTYTNGVIFPYMPQVSTSYTATYTNYDLTHSNYRGYFYQGSQVQEIRIQGTFTAQSTAEANYLLAVIHFFRSVTKMFYGQDDEFRGAPPPLLFLDAFGQYQFNQAPCVLAGFEYTLPDDVDYIKARITDQASSFSIDSNSVSVRRLFNSNLSPGGFANQASAPSTGIETICPTYVPTKMSISISLLPVQSRGQVSRQFSLKDYANGKLIKRGYW